MEGSAIELANSFEPVVGPTIITSFMCIVGLVILSIFFTRTSKRIINAKISTLRIVLLSPSLIYFYIIILLIVITLILRYSLPLLLGMSEENVQLVIQYLNSVSWISEMMAFLLACVLGIRFSMLEKTTDVGYRKILFFFYIFAYEISSVFSYMHTSVDLAIVFSLISPIIVGVGMEHTFVRCIPKMLKKTDLFQNSLFVLPFVGLFVTFSKSIIIYLNNSVVIDRKLDRFLTYQNMIFGFAVIGYCFICTIIISKNLESVALVEEMNEELIEKNVRIHNITIDMLNSLVNAIEAKDEYTCGHSQRVAQYARMISEKMGMSDEETEEIYMYGLLHDIGKIGIPDTIINKTERLTDEEYEYIKAHPKKGADILKDIEEYPDIYMGALYHHERWDGKGYPNRLKGEAIPLVARIIAVADAYDAMTSRRSYRPPMEQSKVKDEIIKGMDSQFESSIASKMVEIIDEDVEYQLKQVII